MDSYDFVVVGAGTAGCLVANRLSRNAECRVLLLEAGPPDHDPLIRIPLLAAINYFRASLNWGYETEAQPGLNERRVAHPRGKVLGGTSSINGMMYMRGHRDDYDNWAAMGLSEWSYEKVLPFFKAYERSLSRANSPYHGSGGELTVTTAKGENPLYSAWLDASREAGFVRTEDFNGLLQEGFGYHDFAIKQGRRVSAASAFLTPIRSRPNLKVLTNSQVTRLLFDGRRCRGVEYRNQGKPCRATASREVVLCGGVFNSPQLLQLSGIGGAELLRARGIEVIVDRPEVGRHLQDHMGLLLEWRCLQPITLYRLYRPDRAFIAVLRAMLFGTGPGSVIPLEAGGIVRSRPDESLSPDLQLTLVPGLSLATNRAGQREHGLMMAVVNLRPKSEGYVAIRSSDPFERPIIQPNYLSDPADMVVLREGVRLARLIASQNALTAYLGTELSPGSNRKTDLELEDWIRSGASSAWHPTGTCRMGVDDGSVVDPELRVRGVDGLRVADASIMPRIIGGNTSAPTMMIGEKAADLMLR